MVAEGLRPATASSSTECSRCSRAPACTRPPSRRTPRRSRTRQRRRRDLEVLHHRPIFATVISAFIVIAGLGGMIARCRSPPYPNIVPPTDRRGRVLSGRDRGRSRRRSPRRSSRRSTASRTCCTCSSTNSGDGTLTIKITFAVGTDPDLAAINVNNRVQAAVPRLPEEVRRQGVMVRKASAELPADRLARFAGRPACDLLALSNYASLNVLDEIRRMPGVGDAQMLAARTTRSASGCSPTSSRSSA